MLNYFSKVTILAFFSTIIFILYYFIFSWHIESFSVYLIFLLFFLLIFWFYKISELFISKKSEKIVFSPAKIILYFLLFLFCVCFAYFSFSSLNQSFLLFWKIIYFLIFPVFFFFIIASFWKKITNFLPKIETFSENTRFLLSLNLGFFSFVSTLAIFSFFSFYNIFLVFWILLFFFILSYKEAFWFIKIFFTKKIILQKKEFLSFKIVSSEIFYLIAFFIIATWFILIVRPFPIGWDDLWVYMNLPNLLANSSATASLWEMYSWQLFTWVWYLLWEPAFAFFLNYFWYILSFITLNIAFFDIFKSKEKSFLFLPAILSTVFIGLPMSIFHSMKDMKLDQWLFFITTFIVFFLYNYLQKIFKKEEISKIYLFIIWLLVGFAFSIKFTSLFLIISILSLLSFFYLGFFWFFGFLFIFFAVFTIWNLWQIMNIAINWNLYISVFAFVIGITLIFIWIYKNKNFKKYFSEVCIFLLWIFLSLLPWLSKNFIEIYPNISVNWLLKWNLQNPKPNLENIYSPEEIIEKNKIKAKRREEDAVTTNEDLKRYLWYESGILPFTNMFWNLTMQVNQWWKFTEISFLFFALIPLIFIFLPFKNKYFCFLIFLFIFLEILLIFDPNLYSNRKSILVENISQNSIEKIFSKNSNWEFTLVYEDLNKLETKIEKEKIPEKEEIISLWKQNRNFLQTLKDYLAILPLQIGYFIIFLMFIIPFLILNYSLKDFEKNFIFKLNLAFATIYIFFWCISSFWIVWYGITMYFCLLLMIWFWALELSKYDETNSQQRFFWSLVFVAIILSFLLCTSVPHTISNLKWIAYVDYKIWKTDYLENTFDLHYNYDKIFFELNIDENKKFDFLKKSIDENILKDEFFWMEKSISEIVDFLKIKAKNWDKKAKESLKNIYKWILNPTKDFENNWNIFRIWTFFKYYISSNQKRVFEDGLLFYFKDYILANSPEKTFENMKNLWFKYLLVDLWAATIDDSESHGLTNRYEELLQSFVAKNLELVSTDSTCLRFWLDLYGKNPDKELFFKITSVSYDSYDQNWKMISRNKKLRDCADEISKFVKTDFETREFPYLKRFRWQNKDEIANSLDKSSYAIFKIK